MRATMTPKMRQRMVELWNAGGEGWMHVFTADALKRLGLVEPTGKYGSGHVAGHPEQKMRLTEAGREWCKRRVDVNKR